jgi:hypothetical protein
MSSVLSQQISESPNATAPITSDLLFVLLRAGTRHLQRTSKKGERGAGDEGGSGIGSGVGLNNNHYNSHNKVPADLTIPNFLTAEDRRPSILDILMDSPRPTEQRRPSAMMNNVLTDPMPRSPECDKKMGTTLLNSGERKASASSTSSLNQGVASPQGGTLNITMANNSGSNCGSLQQQHHQHQQSPSSSSSSSLFPPINTTPNSNNNSINSRSPNAFSPPSILGFRRSSVQSSSISGSSSTDDRPITSESNILDGTAYYNHPSASSSSTMARSHSAQPSSASPTSGEKRKDSFKQQLKRFVGWGSKQKKPAPLNTNTYDNNSSNANYTMQPNSAATTDSPSDTHHFVSAPSTPLPQTPGTPRSLKSRQIPLPSDSRIDQQQQNPKNPQKESKPLPDPSAAAIAAAAAVSAANKRLSTVSSISSSSISTEELSEQAQQVDLDDDSEEEVEHSEKQEIESIHEGKNDVSTIPKKEDVSEIQSQYAMWMNSQTPTEASDSKPPSVLSNNSHPPSTPTKNPLRNNKTLILSEQEQNNSNVMMTSLSNTSTNSTSTATSASSAVTSCSSSKKEEKRVPEQQHDLDDLFLLVAHGVDFLTDKENSKWEEEGGYEFHPWNRPQSSFTVRQAAKAAAAAANKKNTLPAEFTEQPSAEVANESSEDLETASAAIAMSLLSSSDENKPMSPPLTPQTSTEQQEEEQNQESLAKRVLGSEKPSVAAQPVVENQALDDDVSVLFLFLVFYVYCTNNNHYFRNYNVLLHLILCFFKIHAYI